MNDLVNLYENMKDCYDFFTIRHISICLNMLSHVTFWVTRRFTRIQTVWHLENIFSIFQRHSSTLKIEADEKI